jgi:hypothetical protein
MFLVNGNGNGSLEAEGPSHQARSVGLVVCRDQNGLWPTGCRKSAGAFGRQPPIHIPTANKIGLLPWPPCRWMGLVERLFRMDVDQSVGSNTNIKGRVPSLAMCKQRVV